MMSKDDQIIYFANEFHYVTRFHLAQLTGRNPKSLNESLRRLVGQGRLFRAQQGIYKPHVYATYEIRKRQHFNHDLPITEIHLALYRGGRLIEWQQKREKRKGELNEDAVFYFAVPLSERLGRLKIYLEYDNDKEGYEQIEEKLRRYLKKRQEAGEPFHILFVMKSDKKIPRLLSCAQRLLSRDKPLMWKVFLFATFEEILANTLGPICSIAYDPNKYSFAPTVGTTVSTTVES